MCKLFTQWLHNFVSHIIASSSWPRKFWCLRMRTRELQWLQYFTLEYKNVTIWLVLANYVGHTFAFVWWVCVKVCIPGVCMLVWPQICLRTIVFILYFPITSTLSSHPQNLFAFISIIILFENMPLVHDVWCACIKILSDLYTVHGNYTPTPDL